MAPSPCLSAPGVPGRETAEFEIVGAGPAGLAAAITLASAGKSVMVHDRAPDIGWRFHGDLQGIENWTDSDQVPALLERIGIRTDFFLKPYYHGELYGPDLRPRIIRSPEPLFYIVRRGPSPDSLDSALKTQAEDLGVQFRFNSRVIEPSPRALVASGPGRAQTVSKGILFETSGPDRAAGIFSDEAAPKGYAYCLIADGRGTLASVLYDRLADAPHYSRRTLHLFEHLLKLDIQNPRPFSGYGTFSYRLASGRDKENAIGESAGLQDALWGFGIKYALLSGHLAARALLENIPPSRLWRETLLPTFRTSLANRLLFETFGSAAYRYLVRRLSRSSNARKVLHALYTPSWPKSLLYPLSWMEPRADRSSL